MSMKAKHLSDQARDSVIALLEAREQDTNSPPASFYVCHSLNEEAARAFRETFKPRSLNEYSVARTELQIREMRENGWRPAAWMSTFTTGTLEDDLLEGRAHRLLALHLFLVLDENGDLP
jgi:hypothetical protein